MSRDAKTLDFARGCNSIQNQLVNFPTSFIRDREVDVDSTRSNEFAAATAKAGGS
jgi:hypothetical protein